MSLRTSSTPMSSEILLFFFGFAFSASFSASAFPDFSASGSFLTNSRKAQLKCKRSPGGQRLHCSYRTEPWRQSCLRAPRFSPDFSLRRRFSLDPPACLLEPPPSGPRPFLPLPCLPSQTLEVLPPHPDHGKKHGCNLLAVTSDRARTLLYVTLLVPHTSHTCSRTGTCTGSVTLGAGSDDPPPNKVEIVLPSSEKQQSNISVTQRDLQTQCDRCRMSEESGSGTEPGERLCQPVAVGRRGGFWT